MTAEEQGLLGSEYLARHPPLPPGKIAANVNIDGVNIFGRTRDLTMVGHGKSKLDDVDRGAARQMQSRVSSSPTSFPTAASFTVRTSSTSPVGVPAAYFDSGTEIIGKPAGWGKKRSRSGRAVHYHQPSDELRDDWDLEGAVEDTRLLFRLGVKVANAEALPRWNQGDEFEAARQKALGETK